MTITRGEKIILISPVGELQKLGTVYEVANIIEDKGETKIVIRDTGKHMAVGCFILDDMDKYFQRYSDARKWTKWTRLVNAYGDIIGFTRSNNKRVQVKSIDGVKANASCNIDDTFNLDFGVRLASLRCRKKALTKQLKYHLKEMQDINECIIDTESAIKELLKHLED